MIVRSALLASQCKFNCMFYMALRKSAAKIENTLLPTKYFAEHQAILPKSSSIRGRTCSDP